MNGPPKPGSGRGNAPPPVRAVPPPPRDKARPVPPPIAAPPAAEVANLRPPPPPPPPPPAASGAAPPILPQVQVPPIQQVQGSPGLPPDLPSLGLSPAAAAHNGGTPPQAAPAAAVPDAKRSTVEFLFELDSPAREVAPREGARTTMDFVFDLDAPSLTPSRPETEPLPGAGEPQPPAAPASGEAADASAPGQPRIEAEAEGGAGMFAPAGAVAEGETGEQGAAAVPQAAPAAEPRSAAARLELGVSLPPQDRSRSAEEQQRQRVRRALLRVVVCRDAFRFMGFLAIADEDRKQVARMLMELEAVFGGAQGQPSLIKEPEKALNGASPQQLDGVERQLGPIEDKLLALDDMVPPEVFANQLGSPKHHKKLLVRYGRLLVSRRLAAGQRRDRFEAIATRLLVASAADGQRRLLPPERAKPVLEQLIGGLPRKIKEDELNESLEYLHEMRERLGTLTTHEQFFDGFFLDLHGYKVSMREQLVCSEFVYLSVWLNVEVANRIDAWIADLEHLYDSNQLTSEGSPREQITRRLHEQETAVDDSFGVIRRPPPQPRPEPIKAAPAAKRSTNKNERTRAWPQLSIVIDGRVIRLALAVVVILCTATYLAVKTGAAGAPAVRALSHDQLSALSPLLVRGWIKGTDEKRYLDAAVRRSAWQQLDARVRSQRADELAHALKAQGVERAEVAALRGGRVITIEGGVVEFVKGGKL